MAFIINLMGLVLLSNLALLTSGQISYNSETQMCCNGTISDKGDSTSMSCCGSTAYDYEASICCSPDQVTDRPSDNATDVGCCYDQETGTSEIYNYNTQQCCDGRAADKPDRNEWYGCCNGALFNYTTHTCCGGELSETNENEFCCGEEEIYNIKTHVCCTKYGDRTNGYGVVQFQLSEREDNKTECCGLETYDYTTDVCCDGTVQPKKEGMSRDSWGGCCGDETYDYSQQLCCMEYGKSESGNYEVLASALHDIDDNAETALSCCGLNQYNYHEEVCCENSQVIDKPEGADKQEWMSCCGGEVITNYTTHICIDSKLYERENDHSWICGEEQYDYYTHSCCNDEVYEQDSNMKCCDGANELYDSTTHKCCFDKIEPITEEDAEAGNNACCAVQYFDSYTAAGK